METEWNASYLADQRAGGRQGDAVRVQDRKELGPARHPRGAAQEDSPLLLSKARAQQMVLGGQFSLS